MAEAFYLECRVDISLVGGEHGYGTLPIILINNFSHGQYAWLQLSTWNAASTFPSWAVSMVTASSRAKFPLLISSSYWRKKGKLDLTVPVKDVELRISVAEPEPKRAASFWRSYSTPALIFHMVRCFKMFPLTFFCLASTHSVTAAQMLPLCSRRAARASCLDIVPVTSHKK
jgi:hypothetical protein